MALDAYAVSDAQMDDEIGVDALDVKLFGKWSLQDVQVSDMSLQVCYSSVVD